MIFTNLNKELAARLKYIPTPEENALLNSALDYAADSEQRFRVGAADNSGRAGCNTTSLHAEIRMLADAPWAPVKSKPKRPLVAVARLGRDGKRRCSYPCPACHAALIVAGYSRLVCFDEGGQPVALTL